MFTAILLLLLSSAPDAPDEALPPEALGAPPQANEQPTAWACTVETLQSGRQCVFEAEVAASTAVKDQAASNVRTLKDIAHALCLHAARPSSGLAADKNLVGQCERKYTEAAEDACGLGGKVPVIDAKGRFAPEARVCYLKLEKVLQDIATMATVASACCQCAEKQRCPGAGDSCHENVSHQELGTNALVCLSHLCGAACSLMMPEDTPSMGAIRSTTQARRPTRAVESL
ncbi:hypothetical protein [Melittangium boletus]|uniref:Uncharacterized protein n=1 Tax=Melittangium boletus DSM 14713 TaxID=1294270 RepID=A0A250IND9_9BACT|nr:hypothetical protein [Melittangium boletus]ATB32770.1 hypothetical protein MEBOL_006259 [Melittangium boletus DSM 14713]